MTPEIMSQNAAFNRFGTVIPCIVTDFVQNGEDEPFVNVVPSIKRKIYNGRDVEFVEREEILEVPILYCSTQKYGVTIPINPGDTGLLIAADFNIDDWDIEGGEFSETYDSTFRKYEGGFFLPAGWQRPKGIVEYNKNALELRTIDGSNVVSIDGDTGIIKISAATQLDLNAPTITLNGTPITSINPVFTAPIFGAAVDVGPAIPEIIKGVNRP